MKSEDALERQLAGWTPRRPAERVALRLFGADPRRMTEDSTAVWPWLTSASATAAVSLLLLSVPGLSGSGLPQDLAYSAAQRALYAGDSLSHANQWGGQRFEWTRAGATPSSIGSVMVLATNRLGQ